MAFSISAWRRWSAPVPGCRLDRAAQGASRPAGAQRIGVATDQGRRHQRQHLIPRVGKARRTAQIILAVHQLAQTQMMGQRDRKEQPGTGHQAVVVEGDLDAIGMVKLSLNVEVEPGA